MAGSGAAEQTVNGTLTYSSGSIFEWNLMDHTTSGRGVNFDAVNATTFVGSNSATFQVVLGGTASYANEFWNTTQRWTDVFSGGGSSMQTIFGNNFPSIPNRGNFSADGNDLVWSAVPEPSSALVGLLIAAGLARRSRKSAF